MTNRLLILTFTIVVLFGTNGVAFAQNPLRQSVQSQFATPPSQSDSRGNTPPPINRPDVPAEVYAAIYNIENSQANPNDPGRTQSLHSPASTPAGAQSSANIVDPNVAPAVHLSKPKNDIAPLIRMLDSLPNRAPAERSAISREPNRLSPSVPDRANNPLNAPRLETSLRPSAAELDSTEDAQSTESGVSTKEFDREKFQALVTKLAINTGLVMCIGIGFILVTKQYFKGKSPRSNKKTELPIRINSTLKLSPKSSLHLIETGEHRLIVATDQNGIKSMVRLSDSFAHTLDSLDDLAGELSDDRTGRSQPVETNSAGSYSLATLGQFQAVDRKASSAAANNPNLGDDRANDAARKTTEVSEANQEDTIRLKMEAALREHGLKDLILETLRKEGTPLGQTGQTASP